MNIKDINYQKALVLYAFSVTPIFILLFFFGINHPEGMPAPVAFGFSIFFGTVLSFGVPAFIGGIGYGIYRGIYFLCTDTKK